MTEQPQSQSDSAKNAADLLAKISSLEAQLEKNYQALHLLQSASGEAKPGQFEKGTAQEHRKMRSKMLPYLLKLPLRFHLTGPFVYGMIVPFMLLDVSVVIYQATCFRAWRITKVQRSDYIRIDRHHLAYLNGFEKLNCIFCGYANGLLALVSEVAARTEKFWCPIKHAHKIKSPHHLYHAYSDYGDGKAWQQRPDIPGVKPTEPLD